MKKTELKPNLLLAGFQKCGSSSLFHLLNMHPEIIGTSPKETFVLSDPGYQNYSETTAWGTPEFSWSAYYPNDSLGFRSSYYMEGSVSNFYQEKALSYVRENRETKVIFLLRDPLDRFVSTYKYYGGSGVHLIPGTTIDEYYEKCLKKQHNHEAMNHALEHGQYSLFIKKWEDILGTDNILIIGMNQVINDKEKTLIQTFNFLNIEPITDLSLPHKNRSTVSRFPWINRSLVKFLGGLGLSESFFGTVYKKVSEKKPDKVILSDPLKEKLLKYYENEYKVYGHYF